ncbi:rod shape-determining protein MreD [Neptunomonas antarctica]|uniref:Rod shape-determining protein MreD n=1 Tax=Neptunomonas antarctica TaxID=619304 RepID=A0A1N7NWV9_9GAMM|nr:rod shape-determining protein MreD [Neptunomonas antarctica]SIT02778.1 rod shape-determining protein MreD [Neptunomonas antarctica]
MSKRRSGGIMIVVGTLIVGFILSQMPLPSMLVWWRPEWVAMIVIYWVMALPHRFGIGMAWVSGLALDVLKGSLLGMNALSLTTIAFITLILHRRLRMYPLWQQAMMVLVLVGINQLIFHWIQSLTGSTGDTLVFLLPAVVSAILWPWVFVVLRGIRRTFHVN